MSTPTSPSPSEPADLESQREAIRRLAAALLGEHAAKIEGSMRDSIRLVRVAGEPRLGGTRLGGTPDLPAGTAWPTGPNHPLAFLAQLDLAELAPFDHEALLPRDGLLSFFWDAVEWPWGFEPEEAAQIRVLYTPAGSELTTHEKPASLQAPDPNNPVEWRPQVVAPSSEVTLPFFRTAEVRGWKLDGTETEVYCDRVYGKLDSVLPAGSSPYHRVLGHPDPNQGDMGRRMSYTLARKKQDLDRNPIAELEADARTWVLLLQIDTDAELGTHWGEGRLYFFLRRADLAARRFDRAFFQYQQ